MTLPNNFQRMYPDVPAVPSGTAVPSALIGFDFSQASLQDFVDCKRRFQLRYLLQLAWPAIEAEPVLENERYIQQGETFHRLIHQSLLGLSVERLAAMIHDEDLARWWQNYLDFQRMYPLYSAAFAESGNVYPETNLSSALAGFNLVAKCDLILITPDGAATIFDWKTSRQRPRREWLAARLQTRVYPYLLARAGAHLNQGKALLPEQVEMVYWFAGFPDQPERFAYSAEQHQANEGYITRLIEEIKSLGKDEFPLTLDVKRCKYCVYRSLCERGKEAGNMDEREADLEKEGELEAAFDFEQIAEIEF